MEAMMNVLDRINEIQTRMDALARLGESREAAPVKGAAPRDGEDRLASTAAGGAAAPKPFEELVRRASRETQVPGELLHAVIQRESAYDPKAVSPKGAMGLMQLMPDTARDLDVRDPFAPEENVLGGARYLRGLLERFQGNLPRALAAYNAGPESIKDGRIPNYPETKEYVKHVMDSYMKMSGLDSKPAAE